MFTICNECTGYRKAYVLRALLLRIKLALPLHPNTSRGPITNNRLDSMTPFHKDNSQDLAFQDFCKQERK